MEGILQSHTYARSPLRSFGDPEVEERLGYEENSHKGMLTLYIHVRAVTTMPALGIL